MWQLSISTIVFIADTVKKGVFLMPELFRMLDWNSIPKNVLAVGFVLQLARLRQPPVTQALNYDEALNYKEILSEWELL